MRKGSKTIKNKKGIKKRKPFINNLNKTKKVKRRRVKTNFTYKKSNKTKNICYQSTQCIFHGDNYKNTNSSIEFMKYNYNFIAGNKQPKKDDDKIKQE